MNGKRDAGEREHLEIAGRDDECLDADHQCEAVARIARKSSAADGADAQTALDDDEEQARGRRSRRRARALAQGRQREVGVDLGIGWPATDRRQALAEPVPISPPRANAWSDWHDLVARTEGSTNGSSQMSIALTNVREEVGHQGLSPRRTGRPITTRLIRPVAA
jgi:hypothetical protein